MCNFLLHYIFIFFINKKRRQLYGNQVNVGDKAPVVTLPNNALEEITIGGAQGKAQLIMILFN